MTAVLCRHFGLQHIEIAEDIASETFLKATEHWSINGIPENPTAWLYTVANNKAKDYLKRTTIFETKIKKEFTSDVDQGGQNFYFAQQTITDSQLAMIFAVCNPINSPESQICLALQILCGFNVEEIANAFLTKPETVKKRLHRARTNLRKDNFQITGLKEATIQSRLESVLRTLYLLFTEGYYSKSDNHVIRKDLCSEAMRLTLLLIENSLTNTPKANALLALMCFQSSRFDARLNDAGEIILYEEQDKNLWENELMDKGNYYLVNACSGNEFSKYHVEAAIAYWHTQKDDTKEKWENILQLYNQLLQIEYSPIAALNRTFALSKANGKQEAIIEAEKLKLTDSQFYFALLGELYTDIDNLKAKEHFRKAYILAKTENDKKTIQKKISLL